VAGIYLIDKDDNLVELKEQPYDCEARLQELLAHYPSLLAGDQMEGLEPRKWILVAREMGVPAQQDGSDRWSVDHLFLDQDGVPTIVEVKRSSDTRIRREVVGQMLDYAANGLKYWPVESLRTRFEQTCESQEPRQDPAKILADALSTDDSNETGIAAFWLRVKTNLQAGRVRMIFVADEIPFELARIVEFLNSQMDPAEVLAIELKQFTNDTLRTLVPRVVGRTAEALGKKSGGASARQWDETSFFEELERRRGMRESATCRELLSWGRANDLKIRWGSGSQDGSLFLLLELPTSVYYLVSAWTYGRVEIQFKMLSSQPPFDDVEKRLELLRRLNQIPGITIGADAIERRPSIPLEILATSGAVQQLCATMGWVIEEAKRAAVVPR
jgi:hypothetical protein